MKKISFIIIFCLIFNGIQNLSAQEAITREIPYFLKKHQSDYEKSPRKAALAWFEDARLGMFIHWGVWGKYHAAYLDHKSEVTQVTKNPGAAVWISLKVFQRLISDAYTKGKTKENVEVAAEDISVQEKSTVRYIVGAVIKKN